MTETSTLIVGASVAGLAVAGSLRKAGLPFVIVERGEEIAAPWRRHYERLHLHTPKDTSHLPHKPFDASVPQYPSRRQVLEYLEAYRKQFSIVPRFGCAITGLRCAGNAWIAESPGEEFRAANVVLATGLYGQPALPDLAQFSGQVLHSAEFRSGRAFRDRRVLVIGFGNSACEIAIDLLEQGAQPSLSVRGPVQVVPRDLAGIPVATLSHLLGKLPPRVADALVRPILRLRFGDLGKLGLRPLPEGPFASIRAGARIPALDIGAVDLIRQGKIAVFPGITGAAGTLVRFADGREAAFDAIVAATGYTPGGPHIENMAPAVFQPVAGSLLQSVSIGEGLYRCGFRVAPSGHIREISREALFIARQIGSSR